jgi:dTMP kinase
MFEYTSTGQSRHLAELYKNVLTARLPESISSRSFRWYDLCVGPRRGKFITFEGLDGVGKSTQLERLAGKLRNQGIPVVVTREPGGTVAGEKIRQLLLDKRTSGLAPMAELALMFASRAQHIQEIILPGLGAGQIVLCDRFTDSSEAYQGGGRKLGSKPVLELHRVLCGDMKPDLTVLMDSEVAASVERARRRNQARSNSESSDEGRFERENRAFFTRVRNAYLEIAKREPDRVFVVDARGTPETTHAKILQIISKKLGLETASRKADNFS